MPLQVDFLGKFERIQTETVATKQGFHPHKLSQVNIVCVAVLTISKYKAHSQKIA